MSRNKTLDGLRGCLAVLVMVNHVLQLQGYPVLIFPASVAVWIFFMISAYVLTASWDGRFLEFLVRRVLRLWPIYAVCLTAGAMLIHTHLPLLEYIWLPICAANNPPVADPPSWSLTVEVWAMLFMPAFVWVGRRGLGWLFLATAVDCIVSLFYPPAVLLTYFFAGAWMSRYPIKWAPLEGAVPQWLGRISYPLYLCHWPILAGLALPLWASIPLIFAVAEVLTRTVETWSIQASRQAGRSLAHRGALREVHISL